MTPDAGHWIEPPDYTALYFLGTILGILIILNGLRGLLWLAM